MSAKDNGTVCGLVFCGVLSVVAVAGLAASGAAPMPAALEKLPLGSVRPEGWLRTQLELQRDGLTGHAEELYEDIGESDWLTGGKKGGQYAWERGPYYAKGLVALALTLDDAALKAKAERWVTSIIRSQRENGDFGPKEDNWWANMIALHLVRDWGAATGDKRVEPFLRRYFAYQLKRLPEHPLSADSCWAEARVGDELEVLLWLYDRHPEQPLDDLARMLVDQAADWTGYYTRGGEGEYGSKGFRQHIVNFMQGLKLPALKCRLGGDVRDRGAYRSAFGADGWVMKMHGRVDRMVNGSEPLAGRSASEGTELCAIAERILSCQDVVAAIGDLAAADDLETVAYNTLPSALGDDGLGMRYYQLLNQPVCETKRDLGFVNNHEGTCYTPGPDAGYGCCRSNFHFAWPKFVQSMWMRKDGGLAAVAYGPSTLRTTVGGREIVVKAVTDYPFGDTVSLKVVRGGGTFPIFARIPGWDAAKDAGAFRKFERNWQAGDEIKLVFSPKVVTERGIHDSIAVKRGALVYSLKIDAETTALAAPTNRTGFPIREIRPKTPWNYALVVPASGLAARFVPAGDLTGNVFAQGRVPCALKVRGFRTTSGCWGSMRPWIPARPNEPPPSPIVRTAEDGPDEELTFVPMGATQIRMTLFPWGIAGVAGETVFVDTPQKAAAAVRTARGCAERPTDIVFAPGTYEFAEPLEIGAAGSHVRLRAEKPGTVRLTRSVAATPGGTVDCTEPPAPDAENFVSTRAHAPLFFYDHQWAVAARWPNEGWAYFTKAVDSGLRSRIRGGIAPDAPAVAGSFVFDSDRPSKWNFEEGVYLAGYFTHDWAYELLKADSFIVTPSNRVMKMRGAAQYGLASGTWSSEKGRRFYAYNIRAELDAPGEFFYDRKTKKVEFIPPAEGVKEFRAVTKSGPIVRLTGATDVAFEGLTFEYAVGGGLDFNSCTNCRVENCTVANVGGDGIALQGGRGCKVRATRIDTTGLCAVRIAAGDRWTLTSCEHLVEDCEMVRFGTVRRTYAPGVHVSGVGTTLRGNRLHDAPHSAILYHANDCLFERNEVWNVLLETGDAGAFYTGRDPTSRGNVLRFNYVHDLGNSGGMAKNTMAFYLDDCDAGDTVASNRVKNVARGLMLGGGHDNHIIGNTFENCAIGMSIDARGVVWNDRWDSPIDKSWQMTRKVKEMRVEREPWRTKYPLLLTYLEDGPREPRHIDVVGNTFTNCKEPIIWSMRAGEFRHLIRWSDNMTDGRVLERDSSGTGKTPVTWSMEKLGTAPRTWASGYPEKDGVRSLFFEGVPYEGKATRVFAYLAVPKVRPGEKVPGMVLVHGGGGSAFRRWAKFWCEQGYAAISMDTCGAVSGNEFGDAQANHRRHEWAGPQGWEDFASAARKDPRDNWAYHAVAAVIRANSLLRSLPEVDASRIGVTGVSWGGYLTCMAASVDGRFAFAAPVYGCGYLDDNSVWKDNCGKGRYTREEFAKWCALFDPRHYLANAACDFLWVDGSNDFAYPLDSLQKSVESLKTAWYRATRVRMPHGHWACAEHPQELVDFADFKLQKSGRRRNYPFVKSCGENRWGVVTAEWEAGADEIVRAELNWTDDRGAWQKREWKSVPMKLRAPRFTAEAELPDAAVCWYVNGFTADGKCVSGELVMRTDKPAAKPSAALALTVEPGGLTMDGALERVRAARANGERGVAQVTVKGVNRVTKPVVFTAEDHDIAFVGVDGAAVSGGIALKGWKDVGSGVWEADAPKTPSGETMFFDQLWVDGRRASCARLPSEGWLRISSASQTVAEAGAPAKYVEHVVLDDPRAKKLADVSPEEYPDLEVGVICKWSYGLRTLDAYDAKANVFRVRTDFPWRSWKVWNRDGTLVAFFNVRSAFDDPGEWFLDRRAGKVRYRPLPGENLAKAEVVVPHPAVTNLLAFCGDWRADRRVKNVSFRNLSFGDAAAPSKANGPMPIDQHQAASGMDGMIRLEGTVNVTFDGCRVGRCAGHAFRCHSGTVRTHIVNCRVSDIGAGGVWMGADDPKGPDITRTVLEPNRPDSVAWNVISNCVISGGGRYNPEGVGVCLANCSDTAVVHNDISDLYYSGVSVGWVWGYKGSVSQRNDIGFNRIWDLGKGVMSDMGGVYSLGTSFGTRVHDNVIHDVKSFSYGGWGLYTDEGSEGIVEENNLVWNTTDAGFHQHFGVGCVVRNNIFAYNRMNGAVRTERAVVFGVPSSLHVVNNIIYIRDGALAGDGVRNVGGVWANNLWYDLRGKAVARLGGLGWDGWVASGKETGGVFADPLFVDPEHFDFTLRPDSLAIKLGFRPFDPSRAGARLGASDLCRN